MALRGALERYEGIYRYHVTAAWMTGLLSQADPKNYPKLETLIGEQKKAAPVAEDPKQTVHNARMWAVWLNQVNKK